MKLRWTIRDGKKVLQYEQMVAHRFTSGMEWQDVPDEEPKEPEYFVTKQGLDNSGQRCDMIDAKHIIRLVDERLVNQLIESMARAAIYHEDAAEVELKAAISRYRSHVPKEGEK